MSTQRGNYQKGPQKHQNRTAFKNSVHDTSKRTKEINRIELHGLCERCKEIIEWKIKYKKYKPLTVPKKCTKCQQKAVKEAYYIVCVACVTKLNICGKCGADKELVLQPGPSASEQMSMDSQLKRELEMLPERKRSRPYSVIKDVVAQLCDVLVESHMDFPKVLLLPIQGLPLRTFVRLQEQGKLNSENSGDKSKEKISESEDFSDIDENCDSDAEINESLTVDKETIRGVSKVTFKSVEVEAV